MTHDQRPEPTIRHHRTHQSPSPQSVLGSKERHPVVVVLPLCPRHHIKTHHLSDCEQFRECVLKSIRNLSSVRVNWRASTILAQEHGLPFQVLSLFFWFSFASFVSRLMGRRGWSTKTVPEGHPWTTPEVCPMATCTGATQQGRWRQPHVQGRQGQPQAPKTGIRAPHPDEKAAVAQERVSKLEAALRAVGDDDDTVPNLREALKSPPTSRASVNSRQGCTMREFLGTGQEEGGSRQRVVVQAQTELTRLSAELATLRAELERPQSPVVSLDMSAEVQRLRALVEQLSRRRRKMSVPKPTRTPSGCVVGKISSHSAKRRCKSGPKADRGIWKRPSWPAISQKWRGSPNSCLQQHRSGSGSSKNNLLRCHLQWRTW